MNELTVKQYYLYFSHIETNSLRISFKFLMNLQLNVSNLSFEMRFKTQI